MNKMTTTGAVIFLVAFCLAGAGLSAADSKTAEANDQTGPQSPAPKSPPADLSRRSRMTKPECDRLNDILNKLHEQTSGLKSYQAVIEYTFTQNPELIESRTVQKGNVYYLKTKDRSNLRINFDTRTQDDDDEEKHIEQYLFDGVWLTKLDYQNQSVNYYQHAEQDKPIDVFEFISRNFPMIGFSKTRDLNKQFVITLLESQPSEANGSFGLHLNVKKDSIYKDTYRNIDFWLDKTVFLPVKLVAVSTEGDIYEVLLLRSVANKNLKNSIFKLETPPNFSENRYPLHKK